MHLDGDSKMKTVTAIALALTLATGAAFAQGSGGSGSGGAAGGGTEAGKSGMTTGKESAAQNPTPEQCAKGWDSSMRMTQAEFNAGCRK
jgi:hypothetical protein